MFSKVTEIEEPSPKKWQKIIRIYQFLWNILPKKCEIEYPILPKNPLTFDLNPFTIADEDLFYSFGSLDSWDDLFIADSSSFSSTILGKPPCRTLASSSYLFASTTFLWVVWILDVIMSSFSPSLLTSRCISSTTSLLFSILLAISSIY